MSQSRQLAAIMFTDIAGYTALMGADEKKAFELLRKNREIQKPLIKQYNGTWIKELGDGVLASFNTVTDAVMCAGAIHHACIGIDGLRLRIGIHLGEVVFENHDVFGDGVNIASRLQALAPIGGTYVSEAIYKNVSNKKEILTEFIREETLKNVSESVRIYELKLIGTLSYDAEIAQHLKKENIRKSNTKQKILFASLALFVLAAALSWYFIVYQEQGTSSDFDAPEKSIAVLPFVNMSSDPQQEYFSDGLSEELINMFTKLPGLKVIGRTSSFAFKGKNEDLITIGQKLGVAYLLEGSVRKSGNTIRITAQLIKASDGTHLWSETFDRVMNDIFKVQSEISRMIAQKFEIEISPEANAKINETPTDNVEAYEQFQKGYYFMYKKYFNTHLNEDFEKAKKFFEKAIELDPNYAEAYAGLAEVYDELRNKNEQEFPKDLLILKEQLARKALQLKPNSSFVNTAMAWAIMHRTDPKFDSCFYYLKKAYFLAPADPLTNLNLGSTLSLDLGLHAESIPFFLASIKADPLDPTNYAHLGNAYAMTGKYAEAKKAFQTCTEVTNDMFHFEATLLRWQINFGEYDKVQKKLDARPGLYNLLRSQLYAAKGELEKVDIAFRYDNLVLLYTNRNKISKELLARIEKRVDNGSNNFNWLNNINLFNVYRKDPDFKRLLEKAKKNYDANLLKYGNISTLG